MRDELLKIWPAEGISSVLDLGCRDCWFTAGLPGVTRHVGVDVWAPALQLALDKAQAGHLPNFEGVEANALDYLGEAADRSFEAVLAIDLLEHLDPLCAKALLSEMIRVASKLAVVWTTLGMIEQGPYDVDGRDNPYERHEWGPSAKMFQEAGWQIHVFNNWHSDRGGAILAWQYKS